MKRMLSKIMYVYASEKPIIRLYGILYLIGVFIGCAAAVLLRGSFSEQARLLFRPEGCAGFWPAYLQQCFFMLLLFFMGLTVVSVPLLPLYPLYKGFSIGLLLSLALVFNGLRGILLGVPAFFSQNFLYTLLGYFLCYSSARLSVSLFQAMRGSGRHGASYRDFGTHILCLIAVLILLVPAAFFESRIVPMLLRLL